MVLLDQLPGHDRLVAEVEADLEGHSDAYARPLGRRAALIARLHTVSQSGDAPAWRKWRTNGPEIE